MAKKDSEALYQEFLADLKKINPKIEEVLDEATNTKLKESVLARSEMSRQLDALETERKQVSDYLAQEKTKIEGWQKWYGDISQETAATVDELKKYREVYGELDPAATRRAAANLGISKEDLEKEINSKIQSRDMAAIKFVDDLTDLKIDHRDRFKEKLDTGALYKIAGDQNVPLGVAYNIFIKDRVEELQKTEMAEKIEQARKDAVAEYATKHNLPVLNSNADMIVHPLDGKPITDPQERIRAATADFMKRANS